MEVGWKYQRPASHILRHNHSHLVYFTNLIIILIEPKFSGCRFLEIYGFLLACFCYTFRVSALKSIRSNNLQNMIRNMILMSHLDRSYFVTK